MELDLFVGMDLFQNPRLNSELWAGHVPVLPLIRGRNETELWKPGLISRILTRFTKHGRKSVDCVCVEDRSPFFFSFSFLCCCFPKSVDKLGLSRARSCRGGRRGGVEPMLSWVIRDPQAWLRVPWAPPPTVSPFILFVTCSWPPLPCRLHVTSLLCAQILGPLPEGCSLNGTSAVTGVPACAFPAPFLQWAWNTARLGARGSPALASCSPPRCEGSLCTHVWCVSPRVHIPPDERRLPHVYCEQRL